MLPSTGYAIQSVTAGADLTDFTVIVDLADMPVEWWALVDTSDGTKGRAAKDDETELATDWIDFDDGAETGWLRVKWSGTLSSGGANTLRIYPPVAANSSNAAGATYGSDNAYDSGWAAYWTMDEASGSLIDRTVNGLDLAVTGTPTYEATGQVGKAITLDDNGYFSAATPAVTAWPCTMIAWVKPTTISKILTVANVADSGISTQYISLFLRGDVGGDPVVAGQSASVYAQAEKDSFVADTWQHVAAKFISTASRFAYLDGVEGDENTDSTLTVGSYDSTTVGRTGDSTPTGDFEGSLDEVQIHSADRSADWIAEEYSATNDNSAYWGAWAWSGVSGSTGTAAAALETFTASATGTTTAASSTGTAAATLAAFTASASGHRHSSGNLGSIHRVCVRRDDPGNRFRPIPLGQRLLGDVPLGRIPTRHHEGSA
ncbi:MAG: hypothetical protein JRC86_12730 [Deltaproteobacteria bacterium]|nr:hypothetical protein [Deltaproteobacteria bacterium]